MTHSVHIRKPQIFSFLCSLLLIISGMTASQSWAASCETQGDKSNDSSLTPEKTIACIKALHWEAIPANARQLSYAEVLSITELNNLEILVNAEKVKQSKAKKRGIENKRIWLLFKFFNAANLEEAAQHEVTFANEHVQTITHQAYWEATEKYDALMRATTAKYNLFLQIQEGIRELELYKSRFISGESTNFDVLRTQTKLVQLYQKYLTAELAYYQASLDMARFLSLPQSPWLYPSDLSFEGNQLLFRPLKLFNRSGLSTPKQWEDIALNNRPELKEIQAQQESVKSLVKSTVFEDRDESDVLRSSAKQLELKLQDSEQSIRASTILAIQQCDFDLNKLELAEQQLKLAEKAVKQAKTSFKAGFSSNQDDLNAQSDYGQAQVNYVNSLMDVHLSQSRLLYSIGLINKPRLLGQSPLP